MSDVLSSVLASPAALFLDAALLGAGALGLVVTLGLGVVWVVVSGYVWLKGEE